MHVYVCMDYKSVNTVKLSLAEIINDVLVVILFTSDLSLSALPFMAVFGEVVLNALYVE